MTGLCLGHHLHSKNIDLCILEKSRGVGGRLASRRFEEAVFDTGAQFMRARSEAFRNFLLPHLEQNTLKLWKHDEQNNPMYWGAQKMTDLPKALGKDLSVQLNTEIVHFEAHPDHWRLVDTQNDFYTCKQLVLTAPLPQSLKLLSDSNINLDADDFNKMQKINYRITLGLLVLTHLPPPISESWTEFPDHPELERCVDQSAKGVCLKEHGLMFHFTHEFSQKWIDAPEKEIEHAMLNIIRAQGFIPQYHQIKKWRYADPLSTFGQLAYSPSNHPTLHLGGDAFGGGSVEGAWRSAMELFARLKP